MSNFLRDPVWQFVGAFISLLALIVVVFGIRIQLRLSWQQVFSRLFVPIKTMWHWFLPRLKAYWRHVLALVAFLAICLVTYKIYQNIWIIGLLIAYTALLAFIFRTWFPAEQYKIKHKFITVPLDRIANSSIEEHYSDPPQTTEDGQGEIPFLIKRGERGIFNTHYLKGAEAFITLKEPISHVLSVYMLINSGNSRTEHIRSIVGTVELVFEDNSVQEKDLELGKNLREWAPGNIIPGGLVDTATDQHYQPFWAGKNTRGNDAVIDRLEIPIQKRNSDNRLKQIKLIHKHQKNCHLLVFAVTLKQSQ